MQTTEDRVAVREQRTRRARRAELLANVGPKRVSELGFGGREFADRARHELGGALHVRGREHNELDVREAPEAQASSDVVHQSLSGQRVEVTPPKAFDPLTGRAD